MVQFFPILIPPIITEFGYTVTSSSIRGTLLFRTLLYFPAPIVTFWNIVQFLPICALGCITIPTGCGKYVLLFF